MKNKIYNLIRKPVIVGLASSILFLTCFFAIRAMATSYIFTPLTTYASVTNNVMPTGGFVIGNLPLSGKVINIANGGIALGTNQLIVNFQISAGTNTNDICWSTVFVYQPSITNAQTDTFITGSTNIPIYARAQIVVTTNTGVGIVLNQ